METVGEVSKIEKEFAIEWKIRAFSILSSKVGNFYFSPLFSFADASWCLMIYPNGQTEGPLENGGVTNSEGHIDLFLRRTSAGLPISLDFELGLKKLKERSTTQHCIHTFTKVEYFGGYKFVRRSSLLKTKSDFTLDLTVVCRMKRCASAEISSNIATEKCPYCKSTVDADQDPSSHQEKCMDKPIKCPDCSDVVALKDWYNHQCHKKESEASEKLSHDFKTILLSGDLSDTVVKVKGNEFRLHRSILAARNPYFCSMFKNDMKEKSSGIVTIDDCEPDIFHSFIHFVYTGKVKKLSSENVCDLYETADKYQEDELKNECLHFMMNTLCVDNFCDYFTVTLRHNEKDLFQKAIELFTSKGKEIARSVKWQNFVKEYPIQANELFIKTLDRYIK